MKDSPTPPDYAGAAQATAQGSKDVTTDQTWANRPNVTTPWGSQTWDSKSTIDPSTGKPVTSWSSNISLSPSQQQALDSQQTIQQGRSDAAGTLLGQATDAFKMPMAWDSLPEGGGTITAPTIGGSPAPTLGQSNSSIGGTSTGIQTVDPFSFGGIAKSPGDVGTIQTGLAGDSGDYRQKAQDAVWDLQKPALDERRAATETQLANMGLARGSEAWDREMRGVGDSESRARLAAIDSGRVEAGQAFSQDLQSGQFGNNAQQQQFNQGVGTAQLNNQGQAQAFGQGVTAAGVNNSAQAQEFGQNTTKANFENNADQQRFDSAMASAKLGDTRAIQQLQAEISAGGANSLTRQAALAEMMQKRGQPLNELNALLTGQQVNSPQMPNTPQASKAASADLLGAANDQYGAAVQGANFQQGQINNLMNLGAFTFSDARLKTEITTMGVLSTGVRVVHYRYAGLPGWHIGVIAQELQQVQPEAVSIHPSGYLMVDYSRIRA